MSKLGLVYQMLLKECTFYLIPKSLYFQFKGLLFQELALRRLWTYLDQSQMCLVRLFLDLRLLKLRQGQERMLIAFLKDQSLGNPCEQAVLPIFSN